MGKKDRGYSNGRDRTKSPAGRRQAYDDYSDNADISSYGELSKEIS